MTAVKLHLYGSGATSDANRKEHGIARFALNGTTLRFKMLSNGAQEAQVILKSFTMSNTKPGPTKFREIIPAAKHDRNQFMVLYTSSGGSDDSALAIVTVDSPEIIFALDPLFALANFFTSTPPSSAPEEVSQIQAQSGELEQQPAQQGFKLDFRVDLHDISVNVLEDDTRLDSRAISLSIRQILLSQQVR
jgi:vacuolar protein sorting-associated protein 13A/C